MLFMKKFFIVLFLMLTFCMPVCADTFANENNKMLARFEQSINKDLQNNKQLAGQVEIYFNTKPNFKLNSHKIISYDNRELAETIDKTLKNLETSYITTELASIHYIAMITVQNGKAKTDIISKNYYTPKDIKYFNKIRSHVSKIKSSIPKEDYIDMDLAVIELNISSIGKVTGIRLIKSSGDKSYDDKLCNYFLAQTFDIPPADLLKNGYYHIILTINPTSDETLQAHNIYSKQAAEEIKRQIGIYINKTLEFDFYKTGSVKDIKIYNNDYNTINSPAILTELKKVKVTPYTGQIKGDAHTVFLSNKNSYRNVYRYYNKQIAPSLTNSIPEINSFELKPIKCLILMNRNGSIEDIAITQSSGSQQIDDDTVSAIKYNSYEGYEASPTEKFIFEIELYNLNKYLREYYTKYSRTVASYTIGNMPKYGAKYNRTSKIYFQIKNDGKIKSYQLFDYKGELITEKEVDDCIKRLTFPKFPKNIDAEELNVLVDLYDPSNKLFSNILMDSLSVGSAVLYMILR